MKTRDQDVQRRAVMDYGIIVFLFFLYEHLRKAARHPRKEPRLPVLSTSGPDILALGSNGKIDLFDVCVVHPLTEPRLSGSGRYPSSCSSEKQACKRYQHAQLMHELGWTHRLVPLPVSPLGGLDLPTARLIRDSAEAAAHRLGHNAPFAVRSAFCRFASLLVRTNATCFTERL